MTEFDRKVLDNFPGKVVRKDLTSLMKKGANVPTYVLEYLLGMYCATDDEDAIEAGLAKIKRILSENYVRPDQSEYVKSKIKENGQYTIIDKITVELVESEDKYVARFTNLRISPFEVSSDLVVHNEKLLVGGIWCIMKIEYLGLEKEDVLMVGDTVNDEKGAEGAGVDFIPVTWGFGFNKENTFEGKRADQPMDILKHLGGEND